MSPPRHFLATRRGTPGFTLIELVMVLIILGILAVFVLPRIELTRGFDEVGFHNATRATLEYARKSAVAQRRNVRVARAGNNLTFTIDNEGPETAGGVHDLPLPTPDRNCGGSANQLCAPPGITLGGGPTDAFGSPTSLVFSPLGRPSVGTAYTVTNQPNITVEAETGHVH